MKDAPESLKIVFETEKKEKVKRVEVRVEDLVKSFDRVIDLCARVFNGYDKIATEKEETTRKSRGEKIRMKKKNKKWQEQQPALTK